MILYDLFWDAKRDIYCDVCFYEHNQIPYTFNLDVKVIKLKIMLNSDELSSSMTLVDKTTFWRGRW